MESKAKSPGQALHPTLMIYPLGLLAAGVILDMAYLAAGDPSFALVAFWMMMAGIVGGVLAAPFNFIDWLEIPPQTHAKAMFLAQEAGHLLLLLIFTVSWWIRYDSPDRPPLAAVALALAGAGVGLAAVLVGISLSARLGGADGLEATRSFSGARTGGDRTATRI